jgi:hypothetical protein
VTVIDRDGNHDAEDHAVVPVRGAGKKGVVQAEAGICVAGLDPVDIGNTIACRTI